MRLAPASRAASLRSRRVPVSRLASWARLCGLGCVGLPAWARLCGLACVGLPAWACLRSSLASLRSARACHSGCVGLPVWACLCGLALPFALRAIFVPPADVGREEANPTTVRLKQKKSLPSLRRERNFYYPAATRSNVFPCSLVQLTGYIYMPKSASGVSDTVPSALYVARIP